MIKKDDKWFGHGEPIIGEKTKSFFAALHLSIFYGDL